MMIRHFPIFLLFFATFGNIFDPVDGEIQRNSQGRRHHRHRVRQGRSPRRHKPPPPPNAGAPMPFPTPTTPVDFQFTAAHYNLSIYENSIGQRAVAVDPSNPQMVGVWLPRGGYNQIQFRIIEGDKHGRFGVSAKRVGNFAFLQLEHKDPMDVLNREFQSKFHFTIRATVKRKRGLALEATATIDLDVLDENDNPPMFKELAYRVEIGPGLAPNSPLVQLEAFDADEGMNGALYYSLASPSPHFYIEPTTGQLRTFSPLDGLKVPTNFTLDVRIEDRASRLAYHQQKVPREKDTESAPAAQLLSAPPMFSIRNRATVDILVVSEEGTTKRPKLTFRQLQPFQPILDGPAKVDTIVVEDGGGAPSHSVLLELSRLNAEFVWNCAWLDRQNASQFALWLCPPFPKEDLEEALTVRIGVFRILGGGTRRIAFGDHEFQLRADPAVGRKIWLDDAGDGQMVIRLNGSIPPGALLWQFHAGISHSNNAADRRKIRYKLHRLPPQQQQKLPFELDKTTGQLRLIRAPLPDDGIGTQREWNLTVVAQLELGNAQKSLRLQTAPLEVRLVMEGGTGNANCPEFMQIPLGHLLQLEQRHLEQKTPSDGIVWRAKAKDDDRGENGEIVYKLMNDQHNLFDMDPLNGELRLVGTWPSHEQQIRLKILAMDRGWPMSQQTKLELIVQSLPKNGTIEGQRNFVPDPEMLQSTCQLENRHSPEFVTPENSLIGQIDQTAPIGTTIGHILAKDQDDELGGLNGFVQFWLIGADDSGGHFGLESATGRLFLRRNLAELDVEGGGGRAADHLDLAIEVLAVDMAQRGRQKSAKGRFRVRVQGQNMHPPVFSHFAYRSAHREGNLAGAELLQVRATDPDWGRNGQVEYRMAVETDLLSVDPDSGRVRAERALDRETLGDQFTVLVMALDRGMPSKAAFANLTILLDDINDQRPQCARPIERFLMAEDAPNGQMIGCIGAFDKDAAGTKNSEIRFELIVGRQENDEGGENGWHEGDGGMVPFRVDADTGCIFLESQQPLDFEQRTAYKFRVKLWDRGTPPLASEHDCAVEIRLEDIDERRMAPHFAEISLEASVPENAPAGTDVLRVHAEEEEAEEGTRRREIGYRMVGGNGFGFFKLDSNTGMVSTVKELDFEQHQQFWLTIRAEHDHHHGSLRSHQHILVRVLNHNDRLPLFSMPLYTATIAENSEENKVVLKVEATDADEQRMDGKEHRNGGGAIKYSIVKGNSDQHFAIDEHTGYIVTGKRRLDREVTQSEHELQIGACDQGGLCSTATVQIAVEDQNDNAPKFDEKQLAALAAPADRRGHFGRIFATDGDAPGGPNSRLRYWLEGTELIEIDAHGRLFAKEPLKAGTELEMTLNAEDAGNPALRATAIVKMPVLGRASRLSVSNRSPQLMSPEEWREIGLSDSDTLGAVLGIVKAKDEDGDPLWWNIEDEDPDSPMQRIFAFRQVPSGAELILADHLHGLDPNLRELTLKFSVSDGLDTLHDKLTLQIGHHQSPSAHHSATTSRRPHFDADAVPVELSATMPAGFILHRAHAIVPDHKLATAQISHPQRLQYALHSADDQAAFEVFSVDPSTGNVLLAKPLPDRLASPFTLTISACLSADGAPSEQQHNCGFAILKMRRRAENENAPMFTQFDPSQEQSINLPENAAPGDLIYTIEAVDPDPGELGRIIYSLMPAGNEQLHHQISLNASTGELRLEKEWPRHLAEVHLTVRASDSSPTMSKSTKCHLRIFGPKWSQQHHHHRGEAVRLHFDLPSAGHPLLLAFLNGTRDADEGEDAMPAGANFGTILEGPSPAECQQLLAVHFATGQVEFTGAFTEFAELNCTIGLFSPPSMTANDGKNTILQRFSLLLTFISKEAEIPRLASAQFYGQIDADAPIGSQVAVLPPPSSSNSSSASSSSSSIPLRLELTPESGPKSGNIKFRLLSPLETNFLVDAKSGQIRTVAALDSIQKSEWWEFAVLAQHQQEGEEEGTASPPKYSQPALVKIALKRKDGKKMEEMRKNDAEEGKGEGRMAFLPDQIGADFLEKNAGSPEFRFPHKIYNLTLRENQTERALLLSFWPANLPLGQSVQFRLIPQKSVPPEWMANFQLDASAGLLWVDTIGANETAKLDRERRNQLQMAVRMSRAKPSAAALCLLQISLEDVNDNAPEFGESDYGASISEAAKPGDRLLQVRAKDPDAGMNGVVRYTLGEDAPAFIELNKYDGKLTVSAAMAGQRLEIGQQFHFTLVATDRGQPPLHSSIPVALSVVHRHQPVFSHQIYTATVDGEPKAYPHPVQQLRAWSNAEGAQIGYRLLWAPDSDDADDSDLSRYFRLDFDRGQLLLLQSLANDPPREGRHNLSVAAIDITRRDAPTGHAQIVVHHRPRQMVAFKSKLFKWTIAENTPVGTHIGTLHLASTTNSSNIKFTIVHHHHHQQSSSSAPPPPIRIDPSTGAVLLASPLDYEQQQCGGHRLEFQVVAAHGEGGQSAKAIVQLEVLDTNDNVPEFEEGERTEMEVPMDADDQKGSSPLFLHKFNAIDRDNNSWPNGLRYGIMPRPQFPADFIRLDPTNGVLTANWAEQRKRPIEWPIRLNISVTDGLHHAFTSAILKPHPPPPTDFQFQQALFTAILAENTPPGSALGILQVGGGNSPYKFGMAAEMAENETSPIAIEEVSGKIVLATKLEATSKWRRLPLPVRAIDSTGRRAFAQVQLKMAEENSGFPRFAPSPDGYRLALDQWAAQEGDPLVQVLAVDGDKGDRLEYKIIANPEAEKLFQLNSSTGLLTFRKLDNDQVGGGELLLDFSIRVSDAGNPPHQADVPLHIRLLDKPPGGVPPFSRVPQFGQLHYLFALAEDASIGHLLGQLHIKNENAIGQVRFSIANNEQQQSFGVDEHSGKLILKSQLDAEKQTSHHLVVRVAQEDDPQLASICLVSITVMDVNDEAPKFMTAEQSIEVPENVEPGTIVAAFLAFDGDAREENGQVKYGLESADPDDDLDAQVDWTMDGEQGWLQIGPGGLDRERRAVYNLRIVATDAGGLRAVQPIQIRVLDMPDSVPRFDQAFYKLTLRIDEQTVPNRTLATFRVTDADEATNQRDGIRVILLDNPLGMFRVVPSMDRHHHHLVFARVPSRAELPPSSGPALHRNLAMVAFDGLLSSYARLDLELVPAWKDGEDGGEEEEECHQNAIMPSKAIKIAGDLPSGHPILHWPKTQRVELLSTGLDAIFGIRNHSALVVLADYYRQASYTLELLLQQENDENKMCIGQFSCIQTINVQVENANRMAPTFATPQLVLNISEDAFSSIRKGEEGQMHVLTRLEAIDQDSGHFGRIHYAIDHQNSSEPFWIDPNTGVLCLTAPLDREQREEYLLQIVATDGGGLYGKMELKIQVLDINDNAPECGRPLYQIQLLENDNQQGADLLQLEATDKDQPKQHNGGGFLFKLAKNVPNGLVKAIRVSPDGRLSLKEALDFEEWKEGGTSSQGGPAVVIEFGVEVHDRDERRPLMGLCQVQLVLLDVNDNAPHFGMPFYEAEVEENAPVGTQIIRLQALDNDSQHFGRLSYTLIAAQISANKGNGENDSNKNADDLLLDHFSLGDEDGWLRVAKPLDFEQIGEANSIELLVRAEDGGEPPLSAETMVKIRVLDQNDNGPVIGDCTKLTAIVQEGIVPGHTLLSFTVTDADSKNNSGPFRLLLTGDGADAFAVDALHNLITTRPLHFADRQQFQLEIGAQDAGGLRGPNCPLPIRVQPQSRHAPETQPLHIQLMALHGEFLGGPLGQIHATDRDPADLLRFSIASSSENGAPSYKRFSVYPETGQLFAPSDLLPGLHRFNVSVTDGKFVANAPVSVEVFKVDQDALDHAVSIRLRAISAARFVRAYSRRFVELFARLIGVRSGNIRILSLQEIATTGAATIPSGTTAAPTSAVPTSATPNPGKHQQEQQQKMNIERWRRSPSSSSASTAFQHHRRLHRQRRNQHKSPPEGNLELLVAVQRADGGGGPTTTLYYRPAYVKQRLEAGMGQLFEKEAPGLEVISLITEVCRRDTCIRGDCRDRLWLDNSQLFSVIQTGPSGLIGFIGPRHVRTFECICRQGYAGPNCDVPVNKCAKELCKKAELCIPSNPLAAPVKEEGIGFSCACSPGFRSPSCSEPICPSSDGEKAHEECSRQNEAISLLGQGYMELHIAGSTGTGAAGSGVSASLESRMELSIDFRTISANAVLMHGRGLQDEHAIRIVDGRIQYEWDCGSGPGLARIGGGQRVDDGRWHRLKVLRMGRLAKIQLDGGDLKAEGTSPAGSDVLNLFAHSTALIFGARLEPAPVLRRQLVDALNGSGGGGGHSRTAGGRTQWTADELRMGVIEGMVGCIGRLALDGVELPKTQSGIRLFDAAIGCDERSMGPCLGAPCRNGGQCIPTGSAVDVEEATPSFTCQCPARYTGAKCEIDLNACASHPCPNGIPCHNLYGDFHCSCPAGFTGKTCQLRGDWDPCVTAQCGPNGKCVRQKTTFTCQCQPGWSGPFCAAHFVVESSAELEERARKEAEEKEDGNDGGAGQWLSQLLKSSGHLLLALLLICLLTLALTLAVIFTWRRQQQKQRRGQQRRGGANRRLKKFAANGTTLSGSFSKGTAELPMVRGGRRHHPNQQRQQGQGEDPACSPLVPRQTAAPCQGTADRPPPPLPPRYHRRDHPNGGTAALPTVEVKPMPAAHRVEAQQNKTNGLKKGGAGSAENGSLKSANGNAANGNGQKAAKSSRTTPVPPPRHSSGNLVEDPHIGDTCGGIRAFGRPLSQEEVNELNLSGGVGSGASPSPAAHQQQAGSRTSGSYGRKIDQACTAAANTQKQKAKPGGTRSRAEAVTNGQHHQQDANADGHEDANSSSSDYLTMRPVHRAKPFMAANRAKGSSGEQAKSEESAPPPPRHRSTPAHSHKLYDSPTDICQEEEEEGGK